MLKCAKTDKNGKIIMQSYLKSDQLTLEEKRALFMLRSKSFGVKSNFSNMFKSDMSCRICNNPQTFEDEMHTFNCIELTHDFEINSDIKFTDIFEDLPKQIDAIKYFLRIIKRRELVLELRKMNHPK